MWSDLMADQFSALAAFKFSPDRCFLSFTENRFGGRHLTKHLSWTGLGLTSMTIHAVSTEAEILREYHKGICFSQEGLHDRDELLSISPATVPDAGGKHLPDRLPRHAVRQWPQQRSGQAQARLGDCGRFETSPRPRGLVMFAQANKGMLAPEKQRGRSRSRHDVWRWGPAEVSVC